MWLALDSSTDYLSLALMERAPPGNWALKKEVAIGPHKKQSELLPKAISEFLASASVSVGTLSGIVVGIGPGSFTGLRVGLAWAKGLAYASKLALAGASSLAALALEVEGGDLVWPVASSRKGELYWGQYRRKKGGAEVEAVHPERVISFAELAEQMRAEPSAIVGGPPVAALRGELLAAGAPAEQLVEGPLHPAARLLVRLTELRSGYDFQRLASLEPHYVGTSGAERNAPRTR